MWKTLKKEARLVGDNPWEEIQKKNITVHSRRELTIEELRRVCASLKGEMRILFAIGIYTGLRLGDCATLKWGNVDLVRRFISLIPAKTATFVSLAANAGAPFALVQSIVGHSTAEMTRHYFHENDDALKTTVDTLPDVTGLTPAGLLPVPAQVNTPISTAKIFAAINVLPESDLRAIRDAIDKRLAIIV